MAIARPGNYRSRLHTAALVGATAVSSLLLTSAAQAITVDGTLDAGYGTPKVLQDNYTGFGDNTDPSNVEGAVPGPAGTSSGSELDGGYGVVQGGNLYLMFTGDLELNYNHLNVFIGNTTTSQTPVNYTATTGGTALTNTINGSTFPSNMQLSYAVDVNGGGSPTTLYVDQYDILTNSGTNDSYTQPTTPSGNSGTLNNGLVVALNDTNILGVDGNSATPGATELALAPTATTGFELSIPLSTLGNPTGPLQVLADINGSGNGYLSNQFLGPVASGTANPGGNSFNASSQGIQSFAVAVPEPTSVGFIAALGTLLINRRRRTN